MKTILLCLSFGLFTHCGNKEQQSARTIIQDTTSLTSLTHSYTLLRQYEPGDFKNIDILIDSIPLFSSEVIKIGAFVKAAECQDKPCNLITIWDSERALELNESKTDDPQWRKTNWPYVCEHYVADYVVSVGELSLYPFMDSQYQKWGGKEKRPVNHSFKMPTLED